MGKIASRYVRSRSDEQLLSKANEGQVGNCKPEQWVHGIPVVPCGLVAWSLFNDTYRFSVKNKVLEVSKKNIAWKSDKEHKFGSDVYPKNFQKSGLIGGAELNSSIPVSIFFIFVCSPFPFCSLLLFSCVFPIFME